MKNRHSRMIRIPPPTPWGRAHARGLVAACLLWGVYAVPTARAAREAPAETVVRAFEFNGVDPEGWKPTNNLAPLTVRDGRLETRAAGSDANMMVSGLDIPCSQISHVAFRIRSNRSGAVQVYFTTTANPDLAGKPVPTVAYSTPGAWQEFRVKLAGVPGFSGRLTGLRLDPVQGAPDAEIAFDWVRLVRLAPRLLFATFAPDRFPVQPERPFTLTLRVINAGGPMPEGNVFADLEAPAAVRVEKRRAAPGPDEGPGERIRFSWTVRSPQEGPGRFRARVRIGDRIVVEAETLVPAVTTLPSAPPAGTRTLVFGTDGNAALTLRSEAGRGPTAAWAVLRARIPDGTWQVVGALYPLAELVEEEGGTVRRRVPQFPNVERESGDLVISTAATDAARCRIRIEPYADGTVRFRAKLTGGHSLNVLRFSGPVLRVGFGADGAHKTGGLFPGHEFLEGDAPSSNRRVVGPFLYYRPHPDPRTVTVPVLAIERKRVLSGMMWQPLQDWADAGRPALTVAEFASPNFLDGQSNHRIACFVPGPPWRENADLPVAAKPFRLDAGRTLRLDVRVFVRPGDRMVDAVPLWFRVFGIPKAPPPAHTNRECLDLLIRGYAETLWHPAEKGFTTHLFHGNEKPRWIPAFAADVLVHALRSGDFRWPRNIGLGPESTLLDVLGTILADRSAGLDPPPVLKQQGADGGWPYHETTSHNVKEYSAGFADRLGREGAFYNGHTTGIAIRVLQHALQWGDPACRKAGLRALERIRMTRVPIGGQTWEVPAETPDLYAAARLADCFMIGYRLTGDARRLRDARYWLYTGLPFLYAWHVPSENTAVTVLLPGKGDRPGSAYYGEPSRHQVTPWGSLPVFGTSLYRVSWFGTLVHFCGLVWARSVYQYLDYAQDPLLKTAADGVTRVGVNLTVDRRPYVGMLPDGFDVRLNRAQGALIGPMRVEPPLRRVMDLPAFIEPQVHLVRSSHGTLRLMSRAVLQEAGLDRNGLHWRERFLPGQTCEVRIFPLDAGRVREVRAGNRVLPRVERVAKAAEGWGPVHGPDGIGLRIRHRSETERITVRMDGR